MYWYGAGSEVWVETDLAENNSEEYVFFNGKRVARRRQSDAAVFYFFSDHLGSSRGVTNATGGPVEESDYYPFGGERIVVDSLDNNYKFTGKERDNESGLDNFGARYDSSPLGRFMSPDPLGGRLKDPQTLNKYTYVRNNPMNLIDPTGLYTCSGADTQCRDFEQARQEARESKDLDVVRAAEAYGDPDPTKDNGVSVRFAELDKKGEGGVTTSTLAGDDKGNLYAKSDVVINSNLSGTALVAAVGHEGTHVADAQDVVKSITSDKLENFKVGQDITRYQSEQRAFRVTDSILRSANEAYHFYCGGSDCTLGRGLRLPAKLPEEVDRILAHSPLYISNGKPLSPSNQGGSIANITVPH